MLQKLLSSHKKYILFLRRFELLDTFLTRYKQFIIYSIIGFAGLFVDLGLFILLTHVLNVNYLISNFISSSAGIINNFILNAVFNFKKRDKLLLRFLSFSAIGVSGIFLTSLILYILVDKLDVGETLSKILSIGVIVIYQYNLNKRISFREGKEKVQTRN